MTLALAVGLLVGGGVYLMMRRDMLRIAMGFTLLSHGVNLMLITHVPKRFKKYGNISTISGAVNSCTYIGSAIFTYAVALLSEKIGWQSTVGVWALIALLGTACCFVAAGPWKKFYQE